MNDGPLLSFIVLSYNYANYIGQTLRSILAQTVQDFEVIVVDDASSDQSVEAIRSFGDSRIKLFINDHNQGGAASYNRAVEAATGKYLVNLDADDWIAGDKCERQLAEMAERPVEILGTYAWFVDGDGKPHPNAAELSRYSNQPRELNKASAWIGRNCLIRSTTMVQRTAHLRIGLDDPSMVTAPDFELWTRALRAGCRFGMLAEPLTYYRVHDRGVTHGNPTGTFLELSYATLRNLVPMAEAANAADDMARIIRWLVAETGRFGFDAARLHRLLGMLLRTPAFADFAGFATHLASRDDTEEQAVAGRRLLAALPTDAELAIPAKLWADLHAVSEARDYWHDQAEALTAARDFWHDQAEALTAARDFWHDQMEALTAARDFWHDQVEALTAARDFWHQTSDAWEERSRPTPSSSPLQRLLRRLPAGSRSPKGGA